MKRPVSALCCVLAFVGLWFGAVPSASAAPLPAAYGGSSGGDVANVGVNVLGGLQLAGVRLANADSQVDSTATTRSSATSRNLGATVAGLGVAVDQKRQVAPPDNPTDPGTQTLAAVNALGIGATGLTTYDHARWAGDTSCFTGDLANSFVSTDGIGVAPLGLPSILSTGTATTRGTTGLVTTSGLNKAVRSQATGNIADVNLFGTAVQVSVAGDSTLGVTADGSTTTAAADYRPGTVRYTLGGIPRTLNLGDEATFDVGTVAAGRNTVTLKVNQPTTTGTGRSVVSSVDGVVSVTVTTRAPITQTVTGTVTINLLPLSVAAQAPAGGIDCAPDAPTVTTPANGSRTNDATPTYSGTGRTGASINLTLDNGTALTGVATVDGSGSWSYTPTADIADGSHRVSVTQTVNGVTSAASGTNTFTVDATAPSAPTVTAPADGALLRNARPTYTGTAEANSAVTVFVDGSSIGTASADGSGAFSLPAPAGLADGTHTVYATATDATGNTSVASATNTFRVDATAPAAPVVVTPASSSSTRDTTPRITGTAEAGSSVTVYVDGVALPTAVTASAAGTWETTSGTLAEGLHSVRAQATDAAGNVSPFSDANTFTVDRTAPQAPAISSPADGSRSADATPTVTGTGEAGATVTVDIDGTTVGTPTVNGAGRWTLALTTALGDGSHTVTARQTDAAGNVSSSASNSFVVDTTAPAAPVVTGPASGSVHRGPSVTISGTGEPGATVTVTDDLGGVSVPVTVGASGTWTTQDTGLSDGVHTVTAVQTDAVGNSSVRSNAVSFRVAATAPVAPVITSPSNGTVTNDSTLTVSGRGVAGDQVVLTDGTSRVYPTAQVSLSGTWSIDAANLPEGTYTFSATQDDGAGPSGSSNSVTVTVDRTSPVAPVISSPVNGSVVRDTTPRISGTGEAGALVDVKVDGQPIDSVRVGGDGTWSLPLTTALGQGSHTVLAVQSDPAGNASAGASTTFTVDTTPPAAPSITTPADGAALRVASPAIGGTGTAGDTIKLSIDGGPVQTTTVAANGTWSITPATPLSEGSHTAAAVAVDPAGNRSTTADVGFTVDLTAPSAPVVQRPADGSSTKDTTPTLSGLAEAGATVTVSLNGSQVGTPVAASGGTWSLVVPTALAEGTYTVSATATDRAGNTSDTSATTTFTVDLTAPVAPVITAPANAALITDRTPTITGTGETGDRLAVTLDGRALGTTTVNAGTWSVPVTDPLAQGRHTVVATQADAAGNVSDPVTSTFTLDSVAPDAPVISAPSQGSTVTGPDVTVTGTGEAGARLVLTVNGVDQPAVTVASDGTWSVSLTGVDDGTKTATAVQTDAAGNVSTRSADRDFTVGGNAPAAPEVTRPAENAVVSDTTPTISGTGIDGAVVTVKVDGDVVGTAVVANGTWSLTPPNALGQGTHVITATQTVGVVASAESSPVDFTVDSVAPAAPLITAPADGTVTDDSTPAISGTGEPAAVVTVFDGGQRLGTATVGQNGSWALPVGTTLTPGRHDLTAWQTDPAGNTSRTSGTVSVTVDTSAPSAPVISTPAQGATLAGPAVTVTGTGEPGARLTLRLDGTDRPTVTVGSDGTWSVELTGLADGDHAVTAVQTDRAGNASERTDERDFTISPDAPNAPDAPTIASPVQDSTVTGPDVTVTGEGLAGASLVLTVDRVASPAVTVGQDGQWSVRVTGLTDGDHTATAVQSVGGRSSQRTPDRNFTTESTPATPAPQVVSPAAGSRTTDRTPTISGTGVIGATVTVYVDGDSVGTAVVGATGTWSLTPTEPLGLGSHTVVASQQPAGGTESPQSAAVTFTVVPVPPAAPVITDPTSGSTTSDLTPTVSGTGIAGDTVTVSVDGREVAPTVQVDSDGTWSLTLPEQSEGPHDLTATQTDAEGTTSASSDTVRIIVRDVSAPVITAPRSGAVVTVLRPTVSGTGEAGGTVTVTILSGPAAGDALGTTVVASDGTWSLVVDQDLAPGTYGIRATQQVTGTPDLTSNQVSFQVANTPDAPGSFTIRAGDRQLNSSFTAPAAAGGKPVTGYQVSLDAGKTWSTLATKAGSPTSAAVGPVLNGSTYAVQVRAMNANGTGRPTPTVSVKLSAWFADPVSKSDRAKEVAVPKNPTSYKGKLVRTKATNRAHDGTIAYPVGSLKGRQLQPQQAVELGDVLFPFDSATLTSAGKKTIASLAPSLRYVTAVTCEGYADYGGSSAHENALTKARAKAVCDELKRDAKQLTSLTEVGYGSGNPVIIGGKPADRGANRRTVVLIRK